MIFVWVLKNKTNQSLKTLIKHFIRVNIIYTFKHSYIKYIF